MNRVAELMRRAVETGVFPGAVLLVSRFDEIVFHEAFGVTDHVSSRPVKKDTVYDLASLTKPLATAPALMDLVDKGRISTQDRLGDIISEFAGSDKADIRICHLLRHTAGLPDYRHYYRELVKFPREQRKSRLRKMLADEPLLYSPGSVTLYSDPGYMIMDWVVEKVSGTELDRYVSKCVYEPLEIRDLFFTPDAGGKKAGRVFAPTEAIDGGELLCACVHDENARAAGGVCGHAGLFGTAEGVFHLLKDLLLTVSGRSDSAVFSRSVAEKFLEVAEGKDRAMGFDTASSVDSSSGRYFTPGRTVGHLGFTGTSFWMDPGSGVAVILLSNRICPDRQNLKIRFFRPELHDAVMEQMQGKNN